MAIPVIISDLTLAVPTGVDTVYRIRAQNFPDVFSANCDDLPLQFVVNGATGRVVFRITEEGEYDVTITAGNDDGTDTEHLIVTATDEGGGGGGDGTVAVFASKVWSSQNDLELLDFADIDAAGQPVLSFNADSIGADQLAAGAVLARLTYMGGPGKVHQYEFPNDLLTVTGARTTQFVARIEIPSVNPGDFVLVGELLDENGVYLGSSSSVIRNVVFFGEAEENRVTIWAWNAPGVTIPAHSRINFRIFGYPGGV